jgi:flagellar hook protein FlgE
MSVSGTAIASALNALKMYSRRVDRAAETIASAGLVYPSAEPVEGASTTPPTVSAEGAVLDLGAAMTDMMIAQRAFAAQLRVLRTADEMLRDTVNTVGRSR